MSSLWQTIRDLERRVEILEHQGVFLADSFELLNNKDLEFKLNEMKKRVRYLTKKYGRCIVDVTFVN